MKNLKTFTLLLSFLIISLTISSCSKDNIEQSINEKFEKKIPELPTFQTLNTATNSSVQFNPINKYIVKKVNTHFSTFTSDQLVNLYDEYGDINYRKGIFRYQNESENSFLVTIPFIKDETISGLMIVVQKDSDLVFNFFSTEEIMAGQVENLITNYGLSQSYLMLSSLFIHQFDINDTRYNLTRDRIYNLVNFRGSIVSKRCIMSIVYAIEITYTSVGDSNALYETITANGAYEILLVGCNGNNPGGSGGYYPNTDGDGSEGTGGLGGRDDFDPEEDNCGGLISPIAIAKIMKALENVTLPCQTVEEYIQDQLQRWCDNNFDDLDADFQSPTFDQFDVKDVINGAEAIIEDPSFTNCPNLKCIYKELKENNNKLWCNTIGDFDNIVGTDIKLQTGTSGTNHVANYFDLPDNTNKGATTTINSSGQIVIAFNPKLCNATSPLLIATTILHEGIHAEIWRYLKNNWSGDWPAFSNSTYDSNFNKLFELCCESSGISDQHQEMLNNWIDDLAKGLWEFNGKQGAWQHYRYQALKGVYKLNDPCSKSVISNATYEQYKTDYENNITEQFNFESCE